MPHVYITGGKASRWHLGVSQAGLAWKYGRPIGLSPTSGPEREVLGRQAHLHMRRSASLNQFCFLAFRKLE